MYDRHHRFACRRRYAHNVGDIDGCLLPAGDARARLRLSLNYRFGERAAAGQAARAAVGPRKCFLNAHDARVDEDFQGFGSYRETDREYKAYPAGNEHRH
jgi:hypothetical protein